MSDAPAPDQRFTDWLRARTGDDWDGATDHRFVRELAAGEVDDATFRRYLVQDYAFVNTLGRLVASAAATAPTPDARLRLAEFLVTLGTDEDDYFARSFDALGVPQAARDDPDRHPTTRAFVDLLERAAHQGGYAESLAVLVAVEWVYCEWATDVAARGLDDDRFYLGEWVDVHAADEFVDFVAWLREQLDEDGASLSPRRRERVADLFARAVELEVAFFDAAYEAR